MHIYVSTSLHHWTFILYDDILDASSSLRGSLWLVVSLIRGTIGAFWPEGRLVLFDQRDDWCSLTRGTIGALWPERDDWCSLTGEGRLVLFDRRGTIGALWPERDDWCSLTREGRLVLFDQRGTIGALWPERDDWCSLTREGR